MSGANTKKVTSESFQKHDKDTGSPEVQIAILSEEINRLLLHLKKNQKDNHSKRGLLKMVIKRKKLLNFLKIKDEKRHQKILNKIGFKKKK